jgi:hypothetical protein
MRIDVLDFLAAKVLKTILNIFQIDLAKKKLFVYLRPDFEKERRLLLHTNYKAA